MARKIVDGEIRNKARTRAYLLSCVGTILENGTYSELSIAGISRAGGKNPKLIYMYFGNFDNLVVEFLETKMKEVNNRLDEIFKVDLPLKKKSVAKRLGYFFDMIIDDPVLQKILHWELGQNNRFLNKANKKRTQLITDFINKVEQDFPSAVDIKSTLTFLLSSILFYSISISSDISAFDIRIMNDIERGHFKDTIKNHLKSEWK